MKRTLLGALLALGLATAGFTLAASLGAAFGVSRDAGLAGGAIVLFYGLLGAVLGLVVAVILAWRLPVRALAASAAAAVLVGGGSLALLVWRGAQRSAARQYPGAGTPTESPKPARRTTEPTRPVAPE